MLTLLMSGLLACKSGDSEALAEPVVQLDLRPSVRVESVEEQEFVRTLSLPATVFAERFAILAPKRKGVSNPSMFKLETKSNEAMC